MRRSHGASHKLSGGALHMLNRALRPFGLRVLRLHAVSGLSQRRIALSLSIFESKSGVIQAGPFMGTRLTPKFAWGDASIGSVVLGCYEEQLHPALEELIAASPDVVVNIGSAEGTYAVGLALRLPNAQIIAADIEPTALAAVRENAVLNQVESQVHAVLALTLQQFEGHLKSSSRPAVFIDCEGCERSYLNPATAPSLARAMVLVEVHDGLFPETGARLMDWLGATHDIREIIESGRDPHQYDVLRPLPSIDKWLVLSEGRSETMTWLWCTPKAAEATLE